MAELKKKRPFLSSKVKVAIAIGVIAIAVVLAFFAPPEGESSNTTGDPATTPTLTITNLISTVTINRKVMLQGVDLTVTQVMEASKFSDDRKRIGNYTVRVLVQARNHSTAVLDVDYVSLVRLQLPDGSTVTPKYSSVLPIALPKSAQSGFIDFPLTTQVPLSSLMLHLGNDTTMALSS